MEGGPRYDDGSGACRSRGDASCFGWARRVAAYASARALAPETCRTALQRLGKTLRRASLTAALRSCSQHAADGSSMGGWR